MFFNEWQKKTNVSSPVKLSRNYEHATISVSNIAFPLMILNGGERIERSAERSWDEDKSNTLNQKSASEQIINFLHFVV